jgi:hypothetical protein
MLYNQESKNRLSRRGATSLNERQGIAASQVSTDLAVELIVVQERVELAENGIGLMSELGNTGKNV